MKISSLASLMASLGATVAMELDGGGSSTMVVNGARVSGRSSNELSERRVANHLAVKYVEQATTTAGWLAMSGKATSTTSTQALLEPRCGCPQGKRPPPMQAGCMSSRPLPPERSP